MPINDYGLLQDRIRFEDKQMYAFARKMKEMGKLKDPKELFPELYPSTANEGTPLAQGQPSGSTPSLNGGSRAGSHRESVQPFPQEIFVGGEVTIGGAVEDDTRSHLSHTSARSNSSSKRSASTPGSSCGSGGRGKRGPPVHRVVASKGTSAVMEELPPEPPGVLKLPGLTPNSKAKAKSKGKALSPSQKQALESEKIRKIERLEQAIAEERVSRMAFAKDVEQLKSLVSELVSRETSSSPSKPKP